MPRPLIFVVCLAVLTATSACGNGTSAAAPGGGRGGGRGRGGRGGDGGPVPVVTAKAAQRDVPVDLAAIGNVEAYSTVSVRAQVTGQLIDVKFHEGDFVKKDDLLFALDQRPFQAQLEQAEANLKRDEALLAQAEAQLGRDAANAEFSQVTAERTASLVARGIVSKDQADQSRAQADATAAAVKADRAAIESARAQLGAQKAVVESARVALGYTQIRSPLDGRTGNLTVKAGNLVTANTTELMTIAQIQPVYVTFAVPAVNLSAVKDRTGGAPIEVTAVSQESGAQPVVGRLAFIDNVVDVSTDTIKLKAAFDNSDHRLWPGQFARVTVRVATMPNATVVPSQAIQTGQDGQYVFVVKPDSTVEQRPIVAGQRVNDDMVIQKGLQPGETIVTEGQLRLEAGTRVQSGGGRGEGGGRGGRGQGQGRGQRQSQG